ncbi:MAG: Transcription-repair coupling factor [Ignavibacteriae bacterium]|nr:MAG: Transcription-repair coupling factor [Ignavibacteriota bacterium]
MINQIIEKIHNSEIFVNFNEIINNLSIGTTAYLLQTSGAFSTFIINYIINYTGNPIVVVTPDKDTTEKLYDDYINLIGRDGVYLFGERPAYEVELLEVSSPISQIETLKAIFKNEANVIFASAYSFAEKLPQIKGIEKKIIEVKQNTYYNFQNLIEQLEKFDFQRKSFVESCGDFSVRGGIIDVFPFVGTNPIRIEFFGNQIESIREFDPLSQRSIKELNTASIVPDILKFNDSNSNLSLIDYLNDKTMIMLIQADIVETEIKRYNEENLRNVFDWKHLENKLSKFKILKNQTLQTIDVKNKISINFHSTPQPSFNKSIKIFLQKTEELLTNGYSIYIACASEKEAERFEELVNEILLTDDDNLFSNLHIDNLRNYLQIFVQPIHSGFIFHPDKLAVFTEHEIFGRNLQRSITKQKHFKGISFKDLTQLKKGDYVTHIDYGIGIFDGLQKIKIGDTEQEVVRIKYQDNDILYLNLNYVNKIQKYSSREGHIPKLSKLGTKDWENLKLRAKKKIKDIARDLIKLYARRKSEEGFAFSPDTPWQAEMEASFIYEDTPDQARATSEVKNDMENSSPMDRLICGDVGFGKTEVAVRAAFKAVMNNKQVAVLVPTTILAQQHFNTFRDRLEKYSVQIEVLSRFKSKKEQKKIVENLTNGKIDIIIGTHRLLSKDVIFKDLGLLIIDEEHRFGVSAKEKIRLLRTNVDTLTLTATPIPRTLHFSLMGARDLSLIATPPRNRLPIITEIIPAVNGRKFHWEIIREAVLKELHRGGQIYFVHDKIQNINEIANLISQHIPEARVCVAHGQMPATQLEKIMLDFLEKKYDVLVSTKIIESGLDIPNVNTIIINRADKFGMAELYQLRGRVGRSNIQAYAYLLTPPLNTLPKNAIRRLQAIEEFTELGSGFNLAMRDLEIRGAGNLLGAEQSGFILEMGFETYEQILEQAIRELKNEEFKEMLIVEAPVQYETETQIDIDIDAYIPDIYIERDSERLEIYRRLYKLKNVAEIQDISLELKDRFGEYPQEVENLLKVVELKIIASELKIERIKIVDANVNLYFPDRNNESFYGNVYEIGKPLQNILKFIKENQKLKPKLVKKENQLALEFNLEAESKNNNKIEKLIELIRNNF